MFFIFFQFFDIVSMINILCIHFIYVWHVVPLVSETLYLYLRCIMLCSLTPLNNNNWVTRSGGTVNLKIMNRYFNHLTSLKLPFSLLFGSKANICIEMYVHQLRLGGNLIFLAAFGIQV